MADLGNLGQKLEGALGSFGKAMGGDGNDIRVGGAGTDTLIGGFGNDVLTELSDTRMQWIRGPGIAMVFQEPMTSLNPIFTIGEQVMETIRAHERLPQRAARQYAAREQAPPAVWIKQAGSGRCLPVATLPKSFASSPTQYYSQETATK